MEMKVKKHWKKHSMAGGNERESREGRALRLLTAPTLTPAFALSPTPIDVWHQSLPPQQQANADVSCKS